MTEHNANKPSLSRLYRQFAGAHAARSVPGAEDVLALSRVAHADEAAAPLNADLVRFSRALEPLSAQLSADVNAAFGQTVPAIHRQAVVRRGAAPARRWRGAAAIAASLLAVIGVWTLQHGHAPAPASIRVANVPDRIFASSEERQVAGVSARDEIFRGSFSPGAAQDVIFSYHDG